MGGIQCRLCLAADDLRAGALIPQGLAVQREPLRHHVPARAGDNQRKPLALDARKLAHIPDGVAVGATMRHGFSRACRTETYQSSVSGAFQGGLPIRARNNGLYAGQ